MVPPEVAEVPVALVLHETNHLFVWEGRARGSCLRLPLDLGSGLGHREACMGQGKGLTGVGSQASHQKSEQRVPRALQCWRQR